jgi:hypothetical protein
MSKEGGNPKEEEIELQDIVSGQEETIVDLPKEEKKPKYIDKLQSSREKSKAMGGQVGQIETILKEAIGKGELDISQFERTNEKNVPVENRAFKLKDQKVNGKDFTIQKKTFHSLVDHEYSKNTKDEGKRETTINNAYTKGDVEAIKYLADKYPKKVKELVAIEGLSDKNKVAIAKSAMQSKNGPENESIHFHLELDKKTHDAVMKELYPTNIKAPNKTTSSVEKKPTALNIIVDAGKTNFVSIQKERKVISDFVNENPENKKLYIDIYETQSDIRRDIKDNPSLSNVLAGIKEKPDRKIEDTEENKEFKEKCQKLVKSYESLQGDVKDYINMQRFMDSFANEKVVQKLGYAKIDNNPYVEKLTVSTEDELAQEYIKSMNNTIKPKIDNIVQDYEIKSGQHGGGKKEGHRMTFKTGEAQGEHITMFVSKGDKKVHIEDVPKNFTGDVAVDNMVISFKNGKYEGHSGKSDRVDIDKVAEQFKKPDITQYKKLDSNEKKVDFLIEQMKYDNDPKLEKFAKDYAKLTDDEKKPFQDKVVDNKIVSLGEIKANTTLEKEVKSLGEIIKNTQKDLGNDKDKIAEIAKILPIEKEIMGLQKKFDEMDKQLKEKEKEIIKNRTIGDQFIKEDFSGEKEFGTGDNKYKITFENGQYKSHTGTLPKDITEESLTKKFGKYSNLEIEVQGKEEEKKEVKHPTPTLKNIEESRKELKEAKGEFNKFKNSTLSEKQTGKEGINSSVTQISENMKKSGIGIE